MPETSINDPNDQAGTPEQQLEARFAALEASFQAKLDAAVRQGIDQALLSFTIQAGQGVMVSGSGRNITVSIQGMPSAGNKPSPEADDFLEGEEGDMLYNDGSGWVVLANPGTPTTNDWVQRHDGTAPYWEEPGC